MTHRMNPRALIGRPYAVVGLEFEDPGYGGSGYGGLSGPYFRPVAPGSGLVPPGPGAPPGCSPCAPMNGGVINYQQWYYDQCMRREAAARRADQAQRLNGAPKIGLAVRSTGEVVANTTVVVSATPTTPFCPADFKIPRTVAPFFSIASISIGRTEFLADGAAIAADNFASDSTCCPLLQFQPIEPGTTVNVTVVNEDDADHLFQGVFWGIPLKRRMNDYMADYGAGGCF